MLDRIGEQEPGGGGKGAAMAALGTAIVSLVGAAITGWGTALLLIVITAAIAAVIVVVRGRR
jgi:hypothetical protein